MVKIEGDCQDHMEEIAEILNQKGWRSSAGNLFTFRIVNHLRWTYQLKTRYQRLRESGLLTAREVARIIGGAASSVKAISRPTRVLVF